MILPNATGSEENPTLPDSRSLGNLQRHAGVSTLLQDHSAGPGGSPVRWEIKGPWWLRQLPIARILIDLSGSNRAGIASSAGHVQETAAI